MLKTNVTCLLGVVSARGICWDTSPVVSWQWNELTALSRPDVSRLGSEWGDKLQLMCVCLGRKRHFHTEYSQSGMTQTSHSGGVLVTHKFCPHPPILYLSHMHAHTHTQTTPLPLCMGSSQSHCFKELARDSVFSPECVYCRDRCVLGGGVI